MKKFLYAILLIPFVVSGQQFASCPTDSYVQDVYENPLYERYLSKYDVKFYHLSLEVSNLSTYIKGFTTIQLEVLLQTDTLVFQLIDALEVSDIEVNTVPNAGFIHENDALFIPCYCSAGEMLNVTIYYSGEASQDRGFFAGITSAYDNTNEQWVTYTLSEPLNARDWFPVKQVLQDKADSVWVDITCDKDLMAGSNGLLEGIEVKTSGKHTFKWRSRYPIAYYLISFSVADYMDYSYHAALSQPGDSVLVQNYIYDDEAYFLNWKDRIDKTGDLISLFSKLVIDYPFKDEKYGHCVAPLGGGMEHQTMTTLANFNFNLVAHELAHQWFGDNVTCGNWQDIWINEGFASYFEYIALQNLVNQESADKWLEFAKNLAFTETGSVYVPEEEAEDEYRVFDNGLSYKKGAMLLHMIRYILDDDELFFDVLRKYSEKYTDDLATAVEFREVLDSISGLDFSCFFDQWYFGKGYPHFYLSWYSKNDTLYIQSLQESSVAETPLFKTPFDIGINTNSGTEIVRLFQDNREQFFTIPVPGYVNSISFDPNRQLLAKGSVISALAFDNRILMGPNPFNDMLMLRFFQQTSFDRADVYNISGRLLTSSEITSNPFQLELKSLPPGTYILVLNGESGTFMDKIMKE